MSKSLQKITFSIMYPPMLLNNGFHIFDANPKYLEVCVTYRIRHSNVGCLQTRTHGDSLTVLGIPAYKCLSKTVTHNYFLLLAKR